MFYVDWSVTKTNCGGDNDINNHDHDDGDGDDNDDDVIWTLHIC